MPCLITGSAARGERPARSKNASATSSFSCFLTQPPLSERRFVRTAAYYSRCSQIAKAGYRGAARRHGPRRRGAGIGLPAIPEQLEGGPVEGMGGGAGGAVQQIELGAAQGVVLRRADAQVAVET